jgi:hypothetical protein
LQEALQGRTTPASPESHLVTTIESTSERLEEALRGLAADAADLLDELLAAGAELPFDLEVSTSDESPLPMYSYAPLTSQFISEHLVELRRLESHIEVRELSSDEAATGFLMGLWEGRSEFHIAEDRLREAIDSVLATVGNAGGAGTPAGEVLVPLLGFHMPAEQVVLDGVTIVRADAIDDAPLDAVKAGGFVATVHCGFADVAPAAAVADDLRRALRTLHLFRPGGVGIAPHAWVRRAEGWERFGTGAGRARNGGYRLTGTEVADLASFSRTLTERGARMPSLAWAISRFELGNERSSLIEALSDYLLAMRGLLEGGGASGAGLGARIAALVCDGADERESARVCVERAIQIERKLMSGARFRPAADASPLAVIGELEELLRRLLKGLATGELSGDLRARADAVLLTEGLNGGAVAAPVGETAEWRIPEPDADDEPAEVFPEPTASEELDEIRVHRAPIEASEADEIAREAEEETFQHEETTRIVVTDVELPEIMVTDEHETASADAPPTRAEVFVPDPEDAEHGTEADWFASADGELEWPAFASPRRGGSDDSRELDPEAADRVRYLFPVPDATDWNVGELYETSTSN